jgi:hypothetical protein
MPWRRQAGGTKQRSKDTRMRNASLAGVVAKVSLSRAM